jgi:hypothetical protein
MEMLAAPVGLFTPLQVGRCPVGRARIVGEPTCAMLAQPDNYRSSLAYRRPIQGNVMFAAFAGFAVVFQATPLLAPLPQAE